MIRQLERLRPKQIDEALSRRSLIYLPLGTIEWHCHHLPVGLDGATAQALCLAAAEATGGLVFPPLYYGTGGDHATYPWTVMMPEAGAIETLLMHTLRRFHDLAVAQCVIFSGHFADGQLDMIDRVASRWNARGLRPAVAALSVNRCRVLPLPPDHAGAFETLLMAAIAPEQVDLALLTGRGDAVETADRHDPRSPIWGVVGADPRGVRMTDAAPLFRALAAWLADAAGQTVKD